MPISSSAATFDKKKVLKVKHHSLTPNSDPPHRSKEVLSIGANLSGNVRRGIQRSYSTLGGADAKVNAPPEPIVLEARANGAVYVSRTQKEKEKNPDRICLDRRGITAIPVIEGEARLRLLSMQHNLVINLDQLKNQAFPFLVFLDFYDNQLERVNNLHVLENLRVLLLGKNRLKKIEGLGTLRKLEVLDLHGNQICQACGLSDLTELKVLNLAGNQIKNIGVGDLNGLMSLQELNLRRNRLRKLSGFGDAPNLEKLFISNNDIQSIEDMSSIANCSNIKELSIENNPVSSAGDCASFLISFLPKLFHLNTMQITESVRKAAMAWRRNKEMTNNLYTDLSTDVTHNVHRDEVISNARTNWELLRSQTKYLSASSSNVGKSNYLKPDTDIILTSLAKRESKTAQPLKNKGIVKGNILPDKRLNVTRTNSQETENSQNTSSSNATSDFKLPPILVPIVNKIEHKNEVKEGSTKDSLCSIGGNIDSSVCSFITSHSESDDSGSSSESSGFEEKFKVEEKVVGVKKSNSESSSVLDVHIAETNTSSDNNTETSSNLSVNTSVTSSTNESECSRKSGTRKRNAKSATGQRLSHNKTLNRASTAKLTKKQHSPGSDVGMTVFREREQGGDYLIEICGRHLNVYGQGALRFIDKTWCVTKAKDVNIVNFNYANFNHISNVLCKVKPKFPNAEHYVFRETNLYCLGQINALADIQGLISLTVGKEGNPIYDKNWESYAVYRLSHWGLKMINGKEVTDINIEDANREYHGLSELVLWSLPDTLLQPLLVRLRIDVNNSDEDFSPKKWLMSADPALRSVVSKEALQWKKSGSMQEDLMTRQRARSYMSKLLQEMSNTVNKIKMFEEKWPKILQEIVRNTLLDYSQLDLYMKRKLQELKP